MAATHADETKPAIPKPAVTKPAASAPAASKPAPTTAADDEFLEFLGSVDNLARTDIEKVAKAKKTSPDTEAKK